MHSFKMTIRDILADNLQKLRDATPSLSKPKDLVREGVASNGTIGRISKRQVGVSIDKLETIAAAYGLEVWQLLAPTLKATKGKNGKPVITGLPDWPFEMVLKTDYEDLDPQSRIAAEAKMRDAIKEEAAEQLRRKVNAASS